MAVCSRRVAHPRKTAGMVNVVSEGPTMFDPLDPSRDRVQNPPLAQPPIPRLPLQPKTPGQVLDAALAVVLRFAKASARRWWALDSAVQWSIVCAIGFATVAFLVFAVGPADKTPSLPSAPASPSTAAEVRVAEAYEIQKRFVTEEVYRSPYGGSHIDDRVWAQAGMPEVDKWIFSSATETRIVRNGNYFRIRGWIKFTSGLGLSYVCEMQLDPELDTWKLVGHIEQVR